MIPMAKLLMGKQGKLGLTGLKHHVETGEVVGTQVPRAAAVKGTYLPLGTLSGNGFIQFRKGDERSALGV